mmetsp:Transcript_10828/g.34489  ORF Transcript_10828/g.34489 Transcript_10828/m.34489 type:complete len:204 (+) Transcript_10828:848-1459(+)
MLVQQGMQSGAGCKVHRANRVLEWLVQQVARDIEQHIHIHLRSGGITSSAALRQTLQLHAECIQRIAALLPHLASQLGHAVAKQGTALLQGSRKLSSAGVFLIQSQVMNRELARIGAHPGSSRRSLARRQGACNGQRGRGFARRATCLARLHASLAGIRRCVAIASSHCGCIGAAGGVHRNRPCLRGRRKARRASRRPARGHR